ncbi:MCE family protein [Nocardia sp. NPDC057668]|uniref:MCE family protein n=1 Tax=Nocardia sp. NPDC057668 TaxID=3346202 RepID=UPI00366E9D71
MLNRVKPALRQATPKIVALALVAGIVGTGWLVIGSYQQRFDDWVPVTVIADRAGLVMDDGAKVTMTGIDVGEVTGIEYRTGGVAELTLRVRRSALESIPADVRAEISSSTVFGAKVVALTAPAESGPRRLAPGATIDISRVTVELNTIFEQLTDLLTVVDPALLESTLGAMATALQGRGERLGATLDHVSELLAQVNSADPGIAELLVSSAAASGVYADVAPELLRTLQALTTTGGTVTDQQGQLTPLLAGTTAVANSGADVLERNASSLADVLRDLAPTTAMLALYSPVIPCVFKGIAAGNRTNPAAYSAQPGIKMLAGLIPGASPYSYPADLPEVNATGGPHCMGLPATDPVVNVPYLVTDIGVNPFDPSRQGVGLRTPDLLSLLFGLGTGR